MDTSQFVDGGMHAERESFLETLYAKLTFYVQVHINVIDIMLQLHHRQKSWPCIPAHVS